MRLVRHPFPSQGFDDQLSAKGSFFGSRNLTWSSLFPMVRRRTMVGLTRSRKRDQKSGPIHTIESRLVQKKMEFDRVEMTFRLDCDAKA
jgi:hypothetical protein